MKITRSKRVKFIYRDDKDRGVVFSTERKKLTHVCWELKYEKDLEDLRFMSRSIQRFLKDIKR